MFIQNWFILMQNKTESYLFLAISSKCLVSNLFTSNFDNLEWTRNILEIKTIAI